jgi:SAM-dependent MidA family methyltransferase
VHDNSQISIAGLPRPDEHALAHSQALQNVIRAEIVSNDGHISFARFMQLALYEPGLGYYSAGASKFGKSGDFVTAPEISPLFSICLARQCAEVLSELEQPVILELGAGTGIMASDVLAELEQLDCLPESYLILETSADLRQRQRKLIEQEIPQLLARVSWLDQLPDKPFEGIILANEVLDAMPVQRFCLHQDKIEELHVSWRQGGFGWEHFAADDELAKRLETIIAELNIGLNEPYCSELNPHLEAWIASLSSCLEQGLMLFIDYGYSRHEYYHQQRAQGTLLCHYRHHVHADPFINIGLQDITASVDFTALAEAALKADLKLAGFTSQMYFLLGSGLEKILQQNGQRDKVQELEFSRQVKLLTLPGEMGERFKVMALSRKLDNALSGFSLVDHRRRL